MAIPAGRIHYVADDPGDGSTPKSIAFDSFTPEPLGYDELLAARPALPVSIPLSWRGARVYSTDGTDLPIEGACTVSGRFESPFTSRAISLVSGGWLPSALACLDASTIVLLDRNVLSEIVSRFGKGEKTPRNSDFLDLFADLPVRLNPLLYCLEGNAGALPSADAVEAQLSEALTKLAAALPQATLMVSDQSAAATSLLIEEGRRWFEQHSAFLINVATHMPGPVAKRRVESIWENVIASADAAGISRRSLVLLVVLSALCSTNGSGPARSVLKFQREYGPKEAYNALADLRSIEILINLLALFPDQPLQLCTCDRALALLWVGLGIRAPHRHGGYTTTDFDYHPAIVSERASELWRGAQQ